jgi:hypothetical protein
MRWLQPGGGAYGAPLSDPLQLYSKLHRDSHAGPALHFSHGCTTLEDPDALRLHFLFPDLCCRSWLLLWRTRGKGLPDGDGEMGEMEARVNRTLRLT